MSQAEETSLRARLTGAWGAFWFAPVDAHGLGRARALLGLILSGSLLLSWPDAEATLGPDAVISVAAAVAAGARERFSPLDHLPDNASLHLAYGALVLVAIAVMIGWQSRLMLLLAFLGQVALHHRDPWVQHGGDRLLRIGTLLLLLSPAGAALSVDAWRTRRRERAAGQGERSVLVPIFALRLIQVQAAVIYLDTGLQKLAGSTWREGTALYYALSSGNFQRLPAAWLEPLLSSAAGQGLLRASTWLTLGWELAFAPLLLFAPTRRAVLIVGLVVHTGILLTMTVGSFSPIMVWTYLAFFCHPFLRRADPLAAAG